MHALSTPAPPICPRVRPNQKISKSILLACIYLYCALVFNTTAQVPHHKPIHLSSFQSQRYAVLISVAARNTASFLGMSQKQHSTVMQSTGMRTHFIQVMLCLRWLLVCSLVLGTLWFLFSGRHSSPSCPSRHRSIFTLKEKVCFSE